MGDQIARIALVGVVTLGGDLQAAVDARQANQAIRDQVLHLRVPEGDLQEVRGKQPLDALQHRLQRGLQVQAGSHGLGELEENAEGLAGRPGELGSGIRKFPCLFLACEWNRAVYGARGSKSAALDTWSFPTRQAGSGLEAPQ